MTSGTSHTYGRRLLLCCVLVMALTVSVVAASDTRTPLPEPVMYLNMDEGSGQYLVDFSGNGLSGTLIGAARTAHGACSGGLLFDGIDSYVKVTGSSKNHPEQALTVNLWFYIESYDRQVLVSTYNQGGYRLAVDDANDLWWTVRTARGDVSVPIQHESITLNQWHNVAGTYDGRVSRIYLDGILRNSVNGSGSIHYTYPDNAVMLGVDAGTGSLPDDQCNGYLKGGLDEVRIYTKALTYGEVMDDRFQCNREPALLPARIATRTLPASCSNLGKTLFLAGEEQSTQRIIVSNPAEYADWQVNVPAGSRIDVNVRDAYEKIYPDFWYIEISENGKRITRSVAFPNRINTPAEAVISTGNATIQIRYFDGIFRFPSSAFITIQYTPPPKPVVEIMNPILANPIIVIYTASWATLVAIILVIFWLHRREKHKSG